MPTFLVKIRTFVYSPALEESTKPHPQKMGLVGFILSWDAFSDDGTVVPLRDYVKKRTEIFTTWESVARRLTGTEDEDDRDEDEDDKDKEEDTNEAPETTNAEAGGPSVTAARPFAWLLDADESAKLREACIADGIVCVDRGPSKTTFVEAVWDAAPDDYWKHFAVAYDHNHNDAYIYSSQRAAHVSLLDEVDGEDEKAARKEVLSKKRRRLPLTELTDEEVAALSNAAAQDGDWTFLRGH